MADPNNPDERTVYVSNLHEKVTKEILEELFTQVGSLVKVFLKGGDTATPTDSSKPTPPARPKFAFVEFQDVESVIFAVEMLDDIALYGKNIKVLPRDGTVQAEEYRGMRNEIWARRNQQPASSSGQRPSRDVNQSYEVNQTNRYRDYNKRDSGRHYGSMNNLQGPQGLMMTPPPAPPLMGPPPMNYSPATYGMQPMPLHQQYQQFSSPQALMNLSYSDPNLVNAGRYNHGGNESWRQNDQRGKQKKRRYN
ncbi:RNA recognition motif domain-containing protein [Ditylenchus destructor]|uniref:RNA recognition motif domain-containing protein n=1 Tax=Ditylenchus destructor TaxID=166010 RepID=A0AAD4MNT7_9BILA|nr:RNA recognition motif domain-containing protein [Ditylenchus destructor]